MHYLFYSAYSNVSPILGSAWEQYSSHQKILYLNIVDNGHKNTRYKQVPMAKSLIFPLYCTHSSLKKANIMHELSIAYELVAIAEAHVRDAGGSAVERVTVRIGELSGVVEEALQFGYDIATAGTLLEGSSLIVERVPIIAFCPTCAQQQTLDTMQYLACPVCHTPTPDILQGRELEISSMAIQVDEEVSS